MRGERLKARSQASKQERMTEMQKYKSRKTGIKADRNNRRTKITLKQASDQVRKN